ncbi:AAA family ATPase [Pseudomonas viridiflava]|uniref:AAA family ATPase n=1 Tax=Pseudomonas viridiflava TaxID=33069 RepID=UPI000F014AF4|nr:AAA family ATPase [Pseudomonas viridiflava]
MAHLSISNFLAIKSAKVKIRRINIFIGPQAQGKSIISKLVYYFKEFSLDVLDSALEAHDKRQFDSANKEKFEKIFPAYAWEKSTFLIVYDVGDHKIYIENLRVGAKFKFAITYTNSINKALAAGRRLVKAERGGDVSADMGMRNRPSTAGLVRQAVASVLSGGYDLSRLEQTIYIPAGRSFFANLQKSLFSFISSNIPIDFFLKEFGSIYESTRDVAFLRQAARGRPRIVQKMVEDLICGTYVYEKGQDWIEGARGRVGLSHSSSGQQEVLPMAIVLSTWPYFSSKAYLRSFVIEEPEAHLFPIAQGQVVSLIAAAYNAEMNAGDFVITTHSPYILTAFNNLIQADNAVRAFGEHGDPSSVYQLVPAEQHIRFDDVSAHMVLDGAVTSIMDDEYQLIQADAIDQASEYFSARFEKLIELEANAIASHERDFLI